MLNEALLNACNNAAATEQGAPRGIRKKKGKRKKESGKTQSMCMYCREKSGENKARNKEKNGLLSCTWITLTIVTLSFLGSTATTCFPGLRLFAERLPSHPRVTLSTTTKFYRVDSSCTLSRNALLAKQGYLALRSLSPPQQQSFPGSTAAAHYTLQE
eukprot:1158176-Pelagomonas_calceolata.AAC.4